MWKVTCLLLFISLPLRGLSSKEPPKVPSSRYAPLYGPVCGTIGPPVEPRIIGGKPSPLGYLPWMVEIIINPELKVSSLCGGSIISKRHVLSAAHCFQKVKKPSSIVVRVGDLDLKSGVKDGATPMDVGVGKFHIHPRYVHSDDAQRDLGNDIAVLRLDQDLKFTQFIKPICLPLPREVYQAEDRKFVVAAGWGQTSFRGHPSTHLQFAVIPTIPVKDCIKIHNMAGIDVADNPICAGYYDGKTIIQTAQGDSGTPLMAYINKYYYVVGVTSWGWDGKPGPAVNTRVTSFLDWIVSKLN